VASLMPGTTSPTGTVTFLDGTTILNTVPLDSSGVATYSTSSLSGGNHTITAFYSGDPNFPNTTSTALTQTVTAIADTGFELPSVGSGPTAYRYAPTGSPWTFSGGAGVSGNGSGFTSGNPAAPQGAQVAFLQMAGSSISQSATLAAGTYVLTFSAAQRQNFQASFQTIQVKVDGTVVGTITPASTTYATYTTASFNVAAGTHTIAFVGLNPNGGDNTAFIDNVSATLSGPQLADAGFEGPPQANGKFTYSPAGSAWTFYSAGLSANGSGFTSGNSAAPQGAQVAFLQSTGATASQSAYFPAGTYDITFSAAQRQNFQASFQTIQVEVDGAIVSTITPAGTTYASYNTASFNVAAGMHTVAFVGLNPKGGDNTAFIDNVAIVSNGPQVADAGFEGPQQANGSFTYSPVGSSWTFQGAAGLSGNGSGFTSGNPPAPQGSQVAFVQLTNSSISQALYFPAGNYIISFSAAQRQNFNASSQTIEVEVDGTVVGTIMPTSTSYASYATPSFSVLAGTHTIAFVGLNPNGGDNTAFIDNIIITPG
jgi:Bacterial Ig-like domain (group 3)